MEPYRTSSSRSFLAPACLLAAAAAVLIAAPLAAQEDDTGPPRPEGTEQLDRQIAAIRAAASESDPYDFYRRGPYREDVPRPGDFLGHPLGSLHTHHWRVVDYFRALAEAAPDRIHLEQYGTSYEGKPLLLAFVSSEDNLDRRDEIRGLIRRLTEPRGVTPEAVERLATRTPVVVWLDYGNDGNETANVEAGMQVAYQLVAGEGETTRRIRENALVVINPDKNPASHDRFVSWYNAFGVGAADPAGFEHHAPWGVETNNNHYQIDLNRDAWGLTQRENQALASAVLEWRPQVFVDHHGQTEQYFFPPPTLPVNPDLPDSHDRWYEAFGRGNASAFDAQGWQYYTRDVFDLHYPGYWDSWPSLHGAIGMTYETDGGGAKGLRWRREDDTILTFRDGIAHHFVASLATLETAVENREALLRDFAAFFRTAMDRGRQGVPARAYLLEPGPDPRRTAALVATLLRHGVEVQRTTAGFQARGRHHQTGRTAVESFPAGTYVVDMAQPDGRAASTFLRQDVPLDSAFVREQFAIWSRNARRGEDAPTEGLEFYDVTAWSLPIAFGVDTWAVEELPDVVREPVRVPAGALSGTGSWSDQIPFDTGITGGVTAEVAGVSPSDYLRASDTGTGPERAREGAASADGGADAPSGPARQPPRAQSAYLFEPAAEGALRLLAGLLRDGYRVAVATRPLMVAEREFPRGTYVVRVSRNPASIHERIHALAREAQVDVVAAHTAFPGRGEQGPGSGDVEGFTAPRVAVVAGEGVSTTDYGHTWFTLERRLDYPFTPLPLEHVAGGALGEYDVLVVPGGSASGIRRELGRAGRRALEGWVRRGGVLVGWEGAAVFATDADLVEVELVDRSEQEGAVDSLPPEERLAAIDALPQERQPRPPFTSPSADPSALQFVPGAILRAELDLTHWLTLGYGQADLPVLAEGDDFLRLSPTGSNPVVFPGQGDLVLSGFTWPGNTGRWLRGTAHAVAEEVGDGQVILFNSDPNFRLVWRNTTRLFANAIFLGPALGGG